MGVRVRVKVRFRVRVAVRARVRVGVMVRVRGALTGRRYASLPQCVPPSTHLQEAARM